MTERIDLDDLDTGDGADEEGPNPGDWFWREDGDPADEPEAVTDVKTDATTPDARAGTETDGTAATGDSATSDEPVQGSSPMPRVPRENEDRPAGVPVESGGSGAGAGVGEPAGDEGAGADAPAGERADEAERAADGETTGAPAASGPHGGGADDMTLAFTYEAATRLDDFSLVAADAYGWADWVGLVGRVPAHVINKFQRDHNVDLDFFNGSAKGPGERLAAIDRHSMFYAERMVVVGVEGADEEIAGRADWEFVPLAEAAEKAGWDLAE